MPLGRPASRAVVLSSLAACLLSGLLVPLAAEAAAGKTTICHRTSSPNNPYRRITVSQNALANANGHGTHLGGVWQDGARPKWGDVVPDESQGGSANLAINFGAAGQAVWHGTTRTASGRPACGRLSAQQFVAAERAAGVVDADIVEDLNDQSANEDAVLLDALDLRRFTTASLSQLGAVSATTAAATGVTGSTAVLRGRVALGPTSGVPSFVYGTDPQLLTETLSTSASPSTLTGTTDVTASLSGLRPGTPYFFKTVATTAPGSDAEAVLEGDVLTFTTPAAGLDPQTIDFPLLPPLVVGTPTPAPTPTASSSLEVTVRSSTPDVCTVAGLTITPLAAGTCALTADQPGDNTWAPASQVVRTAQVTQPGTPPAAQTITFAPAASYPAGTTSVVLEATATSVLPVTFAVAAGSAATCTVAGSTVTVHAPGSCTVHADQAGSSSWLPAPRVIRTFTVPAAVQSPAAQTITFAPAASYPAGTTSVALEATATSVLPVTFAVAAGSAATCSVAGSTVTVHAPGSCTVHADQAGSSSWLPAPRVTRTFTVPAAVVTPPAPAQPEPAPTQPTATPRPELPAPPVERVQGRERTETAAQLAEQLYPRPRTAQVVVLARSDLYADGLTGSPLAGTLDGPVLLTEPGQLSAATEQELRRVLAADGTVYVLGGPRAVSPGVAADVAGMGYRVTRIGGVDRYDTATLIADRIGAATSVDEVYLATGIDFPDALSAASAAEVTGGVVLLTRGARMPAVTSSWLEAHGTPPVTAVGGAAAAASPRATRIVGSDRYSTAAKVAQAVLPEADGLVMVTGSDFPDGLAGASYAARNEWPMLLVDPRATALTPGQDEYLGQLRGGVKDLVAIGGPAALPPAATSLVSARLDRPGVR